MASSLYESDLSRLLIYPTTGETFTLKELHSNMLKRDLHAHEKLVLLHDDVVRAGARFSCPDVTAVLYLELLLFYYCYF